MQINHFDLQGITAKESHYGPVGSLEGKRGQKIVRIFRRIGVKKTCQLGEGGIKNTNLADVFYEWSILRKQNLNQNVQHGILERSLPKSRSYFLMIWLVAHQTSMTKAKHKFLRFIRCHVIGLEQKAIVTMTGIMQHFPGL